MLCLPQERTPMKPKPSDRIYELANEYDNERGRENMVPSTEAVIWGLVEYLDEQWKEEHDKRVR